MQSGRRETPCSQSSTCTEAPWALQFISLYVTQQMSNVLLIATPKTVVRRVSCSRRWLSLTFWLLLVAA